MLRYVLDKGSFPIFRFIFVRNFCDVFEREQICNKTIRYSCRWWKGRWGGRYGVAALRGACLRGASQAPLWCKDRILVLLLDHLQDVLQLFCCFFAKAVNENFTWSLSRGHFQIWMWKRLYFWCNFFRFFFVFCKQKFWEIHRKILNF